MKKIVGFLILTFCMLALLSVVASADIMTVELLAGQDIIVGEVNVWNDGTNLCVEYNITVEGWVITETHLAVAEVIYDKDGEIIPPPVDVIPQTKKRNPIPGHFLYGDDEFLGEYDVDGNLIGGEDSYEECILLSDLEVEVGDIVYIAAQASLLNLNNIVDYVEDPDLEPGELGVPIYQQETGWGDGIEFADDRNWAMYFLFPEPELEP